MYASLINLPQIYLRPTLILQRKGSRMFPTWALSFLHSKLMGATVCNRSWMKIGEAAQVTRPKRLSYPSHLTMQQLSYKASRVRRHWEIFKTLNIIIIMIMIKINILIIIRCFNMHTSPLKISHWKARKLPLHQIFTNISPLEATRIWCLIEILMIVNYSAKIFEKLVPCIISS